MANTRQSKNSRSGNRREQAERVQPENDTKDALPKDTLKLPDFDFLTIIFD